MMQGESKVVTFKLSSKSFATINFNGTTLVLPGPHELTISRGASHPTAIHQQVVVAVETSETGRSGAYDMAYVLSELPPH
jgi:hypothetical protein